MRYDFVQKVKYAAKEAMKMPFGITPFISYTGRAEEAVNYYMSIFPDSKIESIVYFKEGERGITGKVKNVCFSVMGQKCMAMDFMVMDESDRPAPSWLLSLYVHCSSEEMFKNVFNKLAKEGRVLMGPEPYENFRGVAWLTDTYGITWQLVYE